MLIRNAMILIALFGAIAHADYIAQICLNGLFGLSCQGIYYSSHQQDTFYCKACCPRLRINAVKEFCIDGTKGPARAHVIFQGQNKRCFVEDVKNVKCNQFAVGTNDRRVRCVSYYAETPCNW